MKKSIMTISAVAIATLVACTNQLDTEKSANNSFTTVHFGARSSVASKVALVPSEDETVFFSSWKVGDILAVGYECNAVEPSSGVTNAEWDGSSFASLLPNGKGDWCYKACYPLPGNGNKIDLGVERTQNGNDYNGMYDVMTASVVVKNAEAGKTADGSDVVFNMNRHTAVAYFHLKSNVKENLVSAVLKVTPKTGSDAFIATMRATFDGGVFNPVCDAENGRSEIRLSFPENSPSAEDIRLWFNVLPVEYSAMELTIETENMTTTISKTADGKYEAGHLYKVVKTVDNWTPKYSPKYLIGGSFKWALSEAAEMKHNGGGVFSWYGAASGDFKIMCSNTSWLPSYNRDDNAADKWTATYRTSFDQPDKCFNLSSSANWLIIFNEPALKVSVYSHNGLWLYGNCVPGGQRIQMNTTDNVLFTYEGRLEGGSGKSFKFICDQTKWWPGFVRDGEDLNSLKMRYGIDSSYDTPFFITESGTFRITADILKMEVVLKKIAD